MIIIKNLLKCWINTKVNMHHAWRHVKYFCEIFFFKNVNIVWYLSMFMSIYRCVYTVLAKRTDNISINSPLLFIWRTNYEICGWLAFFAAVCMTSDKLWIISVIHMFKLQSNQIVVGKQALVTNNLLGSTSRNCFIFSLYRRYCFTFN